MVWEITTDCSWEHYRQEREPRSSGRVLLSHALETHVLLNWGMNAVDIADAFSPEGEAADRARVLRAIALFEAPLQDGTFRSWARPFGGGTATPLDTWHWEIDDFAPRFSSSALNLDRPFEWAAAPTHWIFVGDAVVEALFDLHREDLHMPRPHTAIASSPGVLTDVPAPTDGALGDDALLRLPAVERLVGMKKSTIYARIEQGRFPHPVRNGERISTWRRGEIMEWMRDPQ